MVKALCYKSLLRSQLVSLEFFIDIKSFRSHYGLEVDSASNRKEYQEHFLKVKMAGKADNLSTILCRCHEICTLTSWKPPGHSSPVMELLYLTP